MVRRLRIASRGYGGGEELPGVCMYVLYTCSTASYNTCSQGLLASNSGRGGGFGREGVIAVRGDICYVTFGQVVKESTRIDDLPHRFYCRIYVCDMPLGRVGGG